MYIYIYLYTPIHTYMCIYIYILINTHICIMWKKHTKMSLALLFSQYLDPPLDVPPSRRSFQGGLERPSVSPLGMWRYGEYEIYIYIDTYTHVYIYIHIFALHYIELHDTTLHSLLRYMIQPHACTKQVSTNTHGNM